MVFENKKEYLAMVLFLRLSVFLLCLSWSPVPYEQDQMSKAAKILYV